MARSNKKRRIKRRKSKKAGDPAALNKFKSTAKKLGKEKAFQSKWDREIGTSIKKIQKHFPEESRIATLQKTEEALKKRAERQNRFDKLAMSRPPRVDSVKDTNILGMERSPEKIENLTRKKQKKSDKKFYNTLMSEMNTVLTDKSHPNHFNERRKRILNLVKEKDKDSYREICGYTNPSQSNTGCSKRIYEKIEPNGTKRGTDLLDVIAKKYGITPKMELVKKRKTTKTRSSSAGRKRRKRTKKKRHIITRKNKRKRLRRTKKRRRGGMPKGPKPKPSSSSFRKSSFRPLGARDKFKKTRKKKLRFSRSPTVTSGLNTMSTGDSSAEKKFEPISNETEEQSKMDMAENTELINLFSNMRTPSEAERSHNSDKTLASPKPE